MDDSEKSKNCCKKVVLPILIMILVFIGFCILLTGLYFATVYVGYFYSMYIAKIDDDTGCQESKVKEYLSENITNRAVWECPDNCSHKTSQIFYSACFYMGFLTWIIVIPLTCGGGLVVVFIVVVIWDIARKYCIISHPQTIIELQQVLSEKN